MLHYTANKKAVVLLFLLLTIVGIKAATNVNNNWLFRRPNITMAQTAKSGYRPAAGVVGHQQPFAYNQTQWHYNNRTQPKYHNNYTHAQYNQTAYRRPVQQFLNNTRQQSQIRNHTRYGWKFF